MLRTLREPRYAALSVLMLVVAAGCVFAGTWQISRLEGKVSSNDDIRANAHVAVSTVENVLPTVDQAIPSSSEIQYRKITATGTYDVSGQLLVRQRTVNADIGYLVLTPLRTPQATLLVVRGFVPAATATGPLLNVPAPPAGPVAITARVQPGEVRNDRVDLLGGQQAESINPRQQAIRLNTAVYAGYAELEANQPGTEQLTAIPAPDLSNPAGGAVAPQHIAYIIQWYLFALLALAAPVAMARSEQRHRHTDLELDDERPPADALSPQQQRAARLADRYGRAMP